MSTGLGVCGKFHLCIRLPQAHSTAVKAVAASVLATKATARCVPAQVQAPHAHVFRGPACSLLLLLPGFIGALELVPPQCPPPRLLWSMQGPFVAGSEITAADAALFPTFVFFDFILPTYFGGLGWAWRPGCWRAVLLLCGAAAGGDAWPRPPSSQSIHAALAPPVCSCTGWKDVFAGKPKLKSWWENMKKDAEGAKVRPTAAASGCLQNCHPRWRVACLAGWLADWLSVRRD